MSFDHAWIRWLSDVKSWYEDHPLYDEGLEYLVPPDPKRGLKGGYWLEVRDRHRHIGRAVRKAVAETKRCEAASAALANR